MAKLNFSEALEMLNDERPVNRAEVSARALDRHVWIAEWHIPGCLSESQVIVTTKGDAIAACCGMAESEEGTPRGMVSALRKYGRFDSESPLFGTCVNTVSRVRLGDIL